MVSGAFEELREDLHRALDGAFDAWLRRHDARARDVGVELVERDPLSDDVVRHRWPDGSEESFSAGHYFQTEIGGESVMVVVAHAREPKVTWGRPRRRAVTFLSSLSGAAGLYPLTEWVETDDGQMATGVPDPARPRAALKDRDPQPLWLEPWNVSRADRIFSGIANGPSLRVVVERDDERAMAAFGIQVGLVRGRLAMPGRRRFGDQLHPREARADERPQDRRPWAQWSTHMEPSREQMEEVRK